MLSRLLLATFIAATTGTLTMAQVVIGSWNIQTLATNGVVFEGDHQRTESDFAYLRIVRDQLAADVVALQEVTSPYAVAKVFPLEDYVICFSGQYDADREGLAPWYPKERLGSIRPTCYTDPLATLPDPPIGTPRKQYVAVVLRRAASVTVASALDVPEMGMPFEEDDRETKKVEVRAVRWALDLALQTGSERFRLLAVHLKSRCTDGALRNEYWEATDYIWRPDGRYDHHCMTLARQMPVLRAWVQARATANEPFVVVGDMNRRIDAEAAKADQSNFWPIVTGAATSSKADDVAISRVPEGSVAYKACWPDEDGSEFGNAIDYFIFSAGFRPADWADSYRKLRYADIRDPAKPTPLTKKDDKPRTSDHCPVAVKLGSR